MDHGHCTLRLVPEETQVGSHSPAVSVVALSVRLKRQLARDRIKDEWHTLTGKLRRRWPRLTLDDLLLPSGSAEYLAGILQERYDLDRREALLQVYEFESEL